MAFVTTQERNWQLARTVFWGSMVICFSVFLWSFAPSPFDEYKLLKGGVLTQGFLTNTSLDYDQDDGGKTHYSYSYDFFFFLKNGKVITSYGFAEGQPPKDYLDLSKPHPIQVVYLAKNPEINRIKDFLGTTGFDIFRLNSLNVLFCLCFFCYGVYTIKEAIVKFLSINKEYRILEQNAMFKDFDSLKMPM